MRAALAIALIALTAAAPWQPADARWVVRHEWIEPITPFYAPVLLTRNGRSFAAWGERPAWCRHGSRWSCR